mgnify:CR=1 FL=1
MKNRNQRPGLSPKLLSSLYRIIAIMLLALVGVLLYVLATRAEAKEIGRIAYGVGLLAFLLKIGEPMLHIP